MHTFTQHLYLTCYLLPVVTVLRTHSFFTPETDGCAGWTEDICALDEVEIKSTGRNRRRDSITNCLLKTWKSMFSQIEKKKHIYLLSSRLYTTGEKSMVQCKNQSFVRHQATMLCLSAVCSFYERDWHTLAVFLPFLFPLSSTVRNGEACG